MKHFLIIFLLLFLQGNSCLAQEKPLWEALVCDTSHVAESPVTTRSLVLALLKTDTISAKTLKSVFYIEIDLSNINRYMVVKPNETLQFQVENGFLDSLSIHYLSFLLPDNFEVYQRWKNWISPLRDDFIQKRNALMQDFHNQNPKLSIRLMSDLRNRESQKTVLKNGSSLANLSFHEWGLASDFGIYLNNRYTRNPKYYNSLDHLTQKYNLRWGGNFAGFIDISHVQYYYNSAEFIRKHPYLGIEYDFFYDKYIARVRDKIALGEEHFVEDSKELLVELNLLRKGEACLCALIEFTQPNSTFPENYREDQDLLIVYKEDEKVFYIKYPNQLWKKFKTGNWK